MLSKRLIKSNDAGGGVCASDITDIFDDSSGIALYQLNWDGSDMSGNYDGVATDVSFVNGHIDSAGSFNGSSSKVEETSLRMQTSNGYSFWFKTSYAGRQTFFMLGNGSYSDGAELISNTSLQSYFNEGTYYKNYTIPSVSDGNWHHIVVTNNSTTTRNTYLDGSLLVASTEAASNSRIGTGLLIGNLFQTPTYYFNGLIDQFRVFNKAISAAEVSTLYAEVACEKTCTTDTPQIVPDCVAYYKLDGNATDSNGSGTLYDGTATNVNWTQGRFGSAGGFNGSSSGILINDSPALRLTGDYAISIWVNVNLFGSPNSMLIIKDDGNDFSAGYGLTLESAGNLQWSHNDGSNNQNWITNFTPLTSVWYHICAVYSDSSNLRILYVNGQSVDTIVTNTSIAAGTENITIGYIPVYNRRYNGSIDQVKIFDRAITAEEVTTLYNEVQCPSNASFNTVLYTGDATASRQVGGVGFQPDLVWVKSRSVSDNHTLSDSVRGGNNQLFSNTTDQAFTATNSIQSFNTDGFSIGGDSGVNGSGRTFVAWCWKAGGAAVTNTDGDIDSEVSANVDAGFSVVKGDSGSEGAFTVGHGLDAAPELYIIKKTSSDVGGWLTYVATLGADKYLALNSTAAAGTSTMFWNNTNPTTTVFSMYSGQVISNNADFIAYCFHSVAGFSKIGSYSGTGASGNAQTMDFEPAFLLTKKSSGAGSWHIHDNKRNTSNPRIARLYPESSDAETSPSYGMNFYSDGFDFTSGAYNDSGDTYIYMAFANQF